MVLTGVLSIFTGTLIHLDRVALAQTMVHRPTFVGFVLGALGGFPLYGAIMGFLLEFVALFQPPTGSDLPQDETLLAVVAFSATIFIGIPAQELLPVAVMVAFPVAAFSRRLERAIRLINRDIQHRVEHSGLRIEQNIGRAPWLALFARFYLTLGFVASCTALVVAGIFAIKGLELMPFALDWARRLVYMIPVVGIGYEVFRPGSVTRVRWLGAGATVGVLIWLF